MKMKATTIGKRCKYHNGIETCIHIVDLPSMYTTVVQIERQAMDDRRSVSAHAIGDYDQLKRIEWAITYAQQCIADFVAEPEPEPTAN